MIQGCAMYVWGATHKWVVPEGVKLCGHTVFLYAQLAPDDLNQITIFQAVKVLVSQSCLTLCDPMDHSLSGSSVHGILQARILECVAIPFSRGSSWPRDLLHYRQILLLLSHQGNFLTVSTSWYVSRKFSDEMTVFDNEAAPYAVKSYLVILLGQEWLSEK